MKRGRYVVGMGMLAGAPWFLLGDVLVFQLLGLICGGVGGLVGGMVHDWRYPVSKV